MIMFAIRYRAMPKNNILKIMFLATLAITLLEPVINYRFINQSFDRVLIQNTEEEAKSAANHLQSMLSEGTMDLNREVLKDDFSQAIDRAKKEFKFAKLKILSSKGKVIYSIDRAETGEMNRRAYFHEIVAGGNTYMNIVKRDAMSLHGKTIEADVVEVYFPLMKKGSFIGAFEIDYDITQEHKKLHNAILYFSTFPTIVMLCFFIIISITILRLDRNIIERKRVETELIMYAEKLKMSNRDLQEFVSIASHDLQEPLRKVTVFGSRLKSGYAAALDVKGQDYLERMMNAAKRMHELINGLLTFSRVTTKAQPFVPVDLSLLSKEVLADLEISIEQTGGQVEVGDLSTLEADPLQMRQLFQNLISNALKFHRKDKVPSVKISGAFVPSAENSPDAFPSDEKTYQITVEDNGIGFDNIYAERIFGVFQRLHGRQEYEGTGIGLSVCKKIVERHGGTITAKGFPGQGSKFTVILPTRQTT
jgi:signal transduction histidine kinase